MAVFAHQQFLLSGTLQRLLRNGDEEMKPFPKITEEYTHCVDKGDKQRYLRSLSVKGNFSLNFLNNKRIYKETNLWPREARTMYSKNYVSKSKANKYFYSESYVVVILPFTD